ncbi:MAG: aquaporin [Ilumatobacteraceae bacterium]
MPTNRSPNHLRQALLALEVPFGGTFDAPAVEWRRLLSEWFGTFVLVLVAAGAVVVNDASGGAVPLASRVVAPGIVVMGLIYSTGPIGGAHLNPAVTLCFATRGNFPWLRVPGYLLAQLCGAVAAAGVLRALFGDRVSVGATLPGAGFSAGDSLGIELLLTLVLCTVILGTAWGVRTSVPTQPSPLVKLRRAAGSWAAPVSGASMNPARSFGPALVAGDWRSWWVYWIGPVIGGQVAAGLAWVLRGSHTAAGDLAAQGDPDLFS